MAEISHVRLGVRDQAALQRILREGGAQSFPQWLYAELAEEASIRWWGVRGAVGDPDRPGEGALSRLIPHSVDDWTDPPRGLVLATAEADRAAATLEGILPLDWQGDEEDPALAARCRRARIGRSILVIAEPSGDGYLSACLARFGEGPVAAALDGRASSGHHVERNPINLGPASYVRVGDATSPTLIFLHSV